MEAWKRALERKKQNLSGACNSYGRSMGINTDSRPQEDAGERLGR